jgi:hypothetical protein
MIGIRSLVMSHIYGVGRLEQVSVLLDAAERPGYAAERPGGSNQKRRPMSDEWFSLFVNMVVLYYAMWL